MWLNLYGRQAVRHKLKKDAFLPLFWAWAFLATSAYKADDNALEKNTFYLDKGLIDYNYFICSDILYHSE